MNTRHCFSLVALACIAWTNSAAADISLGQMDDFEDSSTQGWVIGTPATNDPTNVSENGNGFLRYTASGGGPGSRMVIYNSESQWNGNFVDAGVTSVLADIRNPGGTNLNLRLAFSDGGLPNGTWFASSNAVVVAAGSDWTPVEFSIGESDLQQVNGTKSYTEILGNVQQMRVLSSTSPNFRGDVMAGTLEIDNITAVPEPSGFLLAAFGMCACSAASASAGSNVRTRREGHRIDNFNRHHRPGTNRSRAMVLCAT